jgi:hypothetical protein
MEGVVAVTSKWSRLYFVSYYIIAVVMVLNLVIAFVVEAYLEQVTVEEEKDDICIGREERDKKSGGSREEQQEQNYDSLGRQDRNEHSIHLRQRNTSTSTTTDGGSNNEEDIFRRATSMPTIGIEEVL